jgi:hypothetical protein
MHLDRDSGQLSQRLREWRLEAPRDPAFRARVRARINAGVATVPWPQFARRHAAVVAAVVLLAFAGGAAGGRGWAKARDAALSARLAEEYVGGLDARLVARR